MTTPPAPALAPVLGPVLVTGGTGRTRARLAARLTRTAATGIGVAPATVQVSP
ncbi:hypothetical protein [Kocuria dechangensis]|nr:hypothetical protein [Kocuria dechangensis]